MSDAITPFTIATPEAELDDLRRRLAATRWPEPATEDGWVQGPPLERMRALVDYWRTDYDWRRCEAWLNAQGQHRTTIDGVDIHFLHIRSRHANALPLLITHGWPGSVIEFRNLIGPLTDPEAHGGKAEDAFHVIAPSLPGYGFSGKPTQRGWGVERIATAWTELMRRLGYARFVAQGGDWGSSVTKNLGIQAPPELAAVHFNMLTVMPANVGTDLDEGEQRAVAAAKLFADVESAYARLHMTRPQTLGYSLADSPVGQAAWIYEKLGRWSDCNGDPETVFSRDDILDNIMLYWLTNSGASSARLYLESMAAGFLPQKIHVPLGFSDFPKEIIRGTRRWADELYSNIIYWNELDYGGHFAAWEQPETFVRELRACFALVR